jgi:pimeloyl-ACP methyl ester carboxylesterase
MEVLIQGALINLLLTESNHTFEECKKNKCPALIITKEKDIIKEKHTKAIAASISKSILYIAPKETHYFLSENPAVFNKAVLDLLNR